MTERPIIFSAPMVRAILEGRKTQTRRVIKPQPIEHKGVCECGPAIAGSMHALIEWLISNKCPYGKPGDRLWVRETWRIGAWNENTGEVYIDYCDGPRKAWLEIPDGEAFERLWVQSSDDAERAGIKPDENGRYTWEPGRSPCRWRPSIHMPRWASRITLEVVSVRVERLQDISEADAIAEGVEWWEEKGYDDCQDYYRDYITRGAVYTAIESFRTLWSSINLPPKPILKRKKVVAYESYPWSAEDFDAQYPGVRKAGIYLGKPITVVPNPWVWAVTFNPLAP